MDLFQSFAVSRPLTNWNSLGVSQASSKKTQAPLEPICSLPRWMRALLGPHSTSRITSESFSSSILMAFFRSLSISPPGDTVLEALSVPVSAFSVDTDALFLGSRLFLIVTGEIEAGNRGCAVVGRADVRPHGKHKWLTAVHTANY